MNSPHSNKEETTQTAAAPQGADAPNEQERQDANTDGGFLCLFHAEGFYYVSTTREHEICCYSTLEKALAPFAEMYGEWHRRGHEASSSVTIYWMKFNPCIVAYKDNADVVERLLGPPPHTWVEMRCVAGSGAGYRCKAENVADIYNAGVQPELINNAMLSPV